MPWGPDMFQLDTLQLATVVMVALGINPLVDCCATCIDGPRLASTSCVCVLCYGPREMLSSQVLPGH